MNKITKITLLYVCALCSCIGLLLAKHQVKVKKKNTNQEQCIKLLKPHFEFPRVTQDALILSDAIYSITPKSQITFTLDKKKKPQYIIMPQNIIWEPIDPKKPAVFMKKYETGQAYRTVNMWLIKLGKKFYNAEDAAGAGRGFEVAKLLELLLEKIVALKEAQEGKK